MYIELVEQASLRPTSAIGKFLEIRFGVKLAGGIGMPVDTMSLNGYVSKLVAFKSDWFPN